MRRWLIVVMLLTPAAAAESEKQKYLEAAQTFKALKAEAASHGDMPRITDPRVRDALGVLANASHTFGGASFPSADLGEVMSICDIANATSNDYKGFGLDAFIQEKATKGLLSRDSDQKTIHALVKELIVRNLVRYQDEVCPLLDFGGRCNAASLPLLAVFINNLPPEQMTDIRRQGLEKLRTGAKEGMVGTVGALSYKLVSEANRRLSLDALARDLPALSATLPVAERAQMRDEIEKVRVNAPQKYQATIDSLLKTLEDARCEGLCRL